MAHGGIGISDKFNAVHGFGEENVYEYADFPPPQLSFTFPGSRETAFMCHVEDTTNFFIGLATSFNNADLVNDLCYEATERNTIPVRPHEIIAGTVWLGLHTDGAWYRCMALRAPVVGKVRVVFIDFGNQAELDVQYNVRYMSSELMDFPPGMISCCWGNVNPSEARYNQLMEMAKRSTEFEIAVTGVSPSIFEGISGIPPRYSISLKTLDGKPIRPTNDGWKCSPQTSATLILTSTQQSDSAIAPNGDSDVTAGPKPMMSTEASAPSAAIILLGTQETLLSKEEQNEKPLLHGALVIVPDGDKEMIITSVSATAQEEPMSGDTNTTFADFKPEEASPVAVVKKLEVIVEEEPIIIDVDEVSAPVCNTVATALPLATTVAGPMLTEPRATTFYMKWRDSEQLSQMEIEQLFTQEEAFPQAVRHATRLTATSSTKLTCDNIAPPYAPGESMSTEASAMSSANIPEEPLMNGGKVVLGKQEEASPESSAMSLGNIPDEPQMSGEQVVLEKQEEASPEASAMSPDDIPEDPLMNGEQVVLEKQEETSPEASAMSADNVPEEPQMNGEKVVLEKQDETSPEAIAMSPGTMLTEVIVMSPGNVPEESQMNGEKVFVEKQDETSPEAIAMSPGTMLTEAIVMSPGNVPEESQMNGEQVVLEKQDGTSPEAIVMSPGNVPADPQMSGNQVLQEKQDEGSPEASAMSPGNIPEEPQMNGEKVVLEKQDETSPEASVMSPGNVPEEPQMNEKQVLLEKTIDASPVVQFTVPNGSTDITDSKAVADVRTDPTDTSSIPIDIIPKEPHVVTEEEQRVLEKEEEEAFSRFYGFTVENGMEYYGIGITTPEFTFEFDIATPEETSPESNQSMLCSTSAGSKKTMLCSKAIQFEEEEEQPDKHLAIKCFLSSPTNTTVNMMTQTPTSKFEHTGPFSPTTSAQLQKKLNIMTIEMERMKVRMHSQDSTMIALQKQNDVWYDLVANLAKGTIDPDDKSVLLALQKSPITTHELRFIS